MLLSLSACAQQDPNIPDGFLLAENEGADYYFYYPETWLLDRCDAGMTSAYVSEVDFSNVSVVPYMPSSDKIMNVMEYFEENKRLMLKTPGADFEMLNGDGVEVKIGGSPAMRYEYLYSIGGVEYRYLQIIAAYDGMFYNFTYKALPENYGTHMDDVNAILAAFAFR